MPLILRAITAGFACQGEHASRPSREAIAQTAEGNTLPGAVCCPGLTTLRHARPVLSSGSFGLSGAFDACGASYGR